MMVSAGRKKISKLGVVSTLLLILAFSTWILAPFTWYPSVDDIDIQLVTKEADKLFSQCADEGFTEKSLPEYIWVEPVNIPYIFSLYARGRNLKGFGIFCSEVIHIPMWNDWWEPNAGLYVLQEGKSFPSYNYSAHNMNNIAGRVYQMNNY